MSWIHAGTAVAVLFTAAAAADDAQRAAATELMHEVAVEPADAPATSPTVLDRPAIDATAGREHKARGASASGTKAHLAGTDEAAEARVEGTQSRAKAHGATDAAAVRVTASNRAAVGVSMGRGDGQAEADCHNAATMTRTVQPGSGMASGGTMPASGTTSSSPATGMTAGGVR